MNPVASEQIDQAIAAALAVQKRAYAPYSHYHVGCAIWASDQLFVGANVENASYGLTICAERSAVATMASQGLREIDLVVVAAQSSPPAAPCGMCLQTLNEFVLDPAKLQVILLTGADQRRDLSLRELFPHGFDRSQLSPKL